MSRPSERRETGEQDPFRSHLDQIFDLKHELIWLAQTIDWPFWKNDMMRFIRMEPVCRPCRRR